MDCLKCGFSNPDNARYCGGCGASVASLQCPHCQSDNAPGSRFCSHCGNSLAEPGQPVRDLNPDSWQSKAERRLLTVMFCDLVGSTSIVADLDPEETRKIIRDFQSHSRAIIEEFGGRITEYLGDGIVAQFIRHETNAERAIKCALELIRKLNDSDITYGTKNKHIQVRCGIATGLAVVGDMLGDARIRSESAIGLPLNLAARIQSLANPDQIVVAGDTHRLTRGLFEFEDMGLHTLKGIKNPQPVWRVLKEKHVSSRFAAHAADITPMVDRKETLDALLSTWENCKQGNAATIVFSGEAGIGKSRILQELGKRISADDYYFLDYQCAPYHVNTSLFPLISRFEDSAGFEHGDSNDVRLAKLESLVRRSGRDIEKAMPPFASLLGLQAEEKWPVPNLDPDEKKQWIFSALIDNMFSLAANKPLLIKIEDVHWIDPTTLELMSRMVRALPGHPILLLITTRPGFDADFMEQPHVNLLEIDRLPQKYTAKLVDAVKGTDSLPREVLNEVIKRTEGIPLFIEELSKSLLEVMNTDGITMNSSQLAKKDIPTTLHDSLLSRIDRLPGASRLVAQLAAVIGREFSFDLLEQVADYQDKNLYKDLTPLLESQLVYQEKPPPAAEFCFKHALVRDVAYENLLQSERVDIHKRIALAIEESYPEIIANTPELLARHFTEGREFEKAVQYWLKAGKKASENSATVEARSHLDLGLSLLKNIDDSDYRDRYELAYLLALGPIVMSESGTGARETNEIYTRALEISNQNSDPGLRFVALWNSWRMSITDGFPEAVKWADELMDFAKQTHEDEHLLQAHHCQWGTLYNLGKQVDCGQHIDIGLQLYDAARHANHASIYGGHDPKVCGLSQNALSMWLKGYPDQSVQEMNKAIEWTDSLGHLGSLLHNLDTRIMLYKFLCDIDSLKRELTNLSDLCKEHELLDYTAKEKIFSGWVKLFENRLKEGLHLLEQGLNMQLHTGNWEDRPVYFEMSAELKGRLGLYDSAMNDIERALNDSATSGVSYWDAELYRRKGELLMSREGADSKDAEAAFDKSLEIARHQNVKSLELRAACSYARLLSSRENYLAAHSLLKRSYEFFSEGFNTKDLSQARDLLDSIEAKR